MERVGVGVNFRISFSGSLRFKFYSGHRLSCLSVSLLSLAPERKLLVQCLKISTLYKPCS
jgi:hypothetical protein